MRVGADTGGTFTDVVTETGSIVKVLSTPDDPSVAVAQGLDEAGAADPDHLAHGTTVATNTVLERDGARVALVTTAGVADVIEIARQTRPRLYDHWADRAEPLVPRQLRLEVIERLAGDGSVVTPLGSVPEIPPDVDAVAVCLLHADLNPDHETAVMRVLLDAGWDATASHEVAPEFREYERTVTTVMNAYLRPRCREYVRGVGRLATQVTVMTSAGGLLDAEEAAEQPARLLVSGPAGGARAAAAFAEACGIAHVVSFDMGGTSTDVCLVRGGLPEPAAQREIEGFPVRLPSLDVHTIGAGGGSIARIDPGGALVVGPASAGAEPGPACYGRGGTRPTVTDANLLLERIPAEAVFGDLGALDVDASRRACADAGVTPDGIVEVVNANMARALRTVTVERGVDAREVALVAFGGAGPLHTAELAADLGIETVVVPPRAGVLSAVGLLCAPQQRDLVRSWRDVDDHDGVHRALDALAEEAADRLGDGDADVEVAVDCRYRGQSHELTVPSVAEFAAEHARRNGYDREGTPIEVVALRATARRAAPFAVTDLAVPDHRRSFRATTGPKVIAEPDCTVWVPEGWRAEAGPAGCLLLRAQ